MRIGSGIGYSRGMQGGRQTKAWWAAFGPRALSVCVLKDLLIFSFTFILLFDHVYVLHTQLAISICERMCKAWSAVSSSIIVIGSPSVFSASFVVLHHCKVSYLLVLVFLLILYFLQSPSASLYDSFPYISAWPGTIDDLMDCINIHWRYHWKTMEGLEAISLSTVSISSYTLGPKAIGMSIGTFQGRKAAHHIAARNTLYWSHMLKWTIFSWQSSSNYPSVADVGYHKYITVARIKYSYTAVMYF